MKPSFEIYKGDAIKKMREIINEGFRANLICCDPPYLLTRGGQTPGGVHATLGGKRGYDNGGHLVDCQVDWPEFMKLFYQILKDRSHAYVMSNNRNVQAMLNAAEKSAFGFHNLLVWDKVTATPNRWYMKNCEFTGMFYKGKAKAINDCSAMSCIRYSHKDETPHPTEKPVALMRMYIENSTKPGDTVMDPFMGTGATGVAALSCGRNFIGIEQDNEWFDIAKTRLEAAQCNQQTEMF